jgi:hypothetical protein
MRLQSVDVRAASAFLFSRIVTITAFAASALYSVEMTFPRALATWDGIWYLAIARHGYPTALSTDYNELAFFPAFPLLLRSVAFVTTLDPRTVGIVLNVMLGVAFAVLFMRLGTRVVGTEVAMRAVVLCAFFPGAYVLSMVYSEPLMLVLVCASLLALLDRCWLLAGVLAAVATATRPNALALVVACAVAAASAIRTRGEWRALAAPLLAPLGFVSFMVYLWVHTGHADAWWYTQRHAWHESFDFGGFTLQRFGRVASEPFANTNDLVAVVGTVVLVAGLVLLVRLSRRGDVPWVLTSYALASGVLALGSATIGGRPRMVLVAFPMFLAFARYLRGDNYAIAVGVSGALFAIGAFLTPIWLYLLP